MTTVESLIIESAFDYKLIRAEYDYDLNLSENSQVIASTTWPSLRTATNTVWGITQSDFVAATSHFLFRWARCTKSFGSGLSNRNSSIEKSTDINSTQSEATPTISTNLIKGEEYIASQSTGAEIRQRFFLLIFIASTIRVCSLISEIGTLSILPESSQDQPEKVIQVTKTHIALLSFGQWLLAILIWIPSLLFVTMYGLSVSMASADFLCIHCVALRNNPYDDHFTLTKSAGGFWRICDIVLGSIYFIGFFTISYYSVRLIWFFKNQQQDEEYPLTLSGSQESDGNAHQNSITHSRKRSWSLAGTSSSQQAVVRRIITSTWVSTMSHWNLSCILLRVCSVCIADFFHSQTIREFLGSPQVHAHSRQHFGKVSTAECSHTKSFASSSSLL
ncbi:unnamed protein product [Albugo candida]|uniref:Uncharacterized protein n=1 Tax=Albugo candida TaxID=65357 RepID=A0A024FW04_9STRA|nr:unnamed protein product [Albugo candida]|eukprot:CCI11343.1 unnamed protein product [Albugo candida]